MCELRTPTGSNSSGFESCCCWCKVFRAKSSGGVAGDESCNLFLFGSFFDGGTESPKL